MNATGLDNHATILEGVSMAKAAFWHMHENERRRIALVAKRMFEDGYTAPAVCERFNIPMTTLINICRAYGIDVPRQRKRQTGRQKE